MSWMLLNFLLGPRGGLFIGNLDDICELPYILYTGSLCCCKTSVYILMAC